jgi:hypothetical protein
MLHYKSDSGKD